MRLQRGVALISVLLVMATAVTLVSWLVSRQWLDLRRTTNLLQTRQAHYYTLAAETYARQLLAADLNAGEHDHLGERWAQPLDEPLSIEGGALAMSIDDCQGRFNINNIVDSQGQVRESELARFGRLLSALGMPARYADELRDWLDSDVQRAPTGAEDADYEKRRTAGGWISVVGEIRQLKSMRAEDFQRLRAQLCALPGRTRINVNTASVELLRALSPIISASRARSLAARQSTGGWESVGQFLRDAGLDGQGLAAELSVASEYFQVRSEARYDRQRAQLSSVLRRRSVDGGIDFELLSRQQRLTQPLEREERP